MKKVYLVSLALFISGALPGCYNRQLARAAEDLEESGYDKPRSFEYKLLGQRTAEGELEVVVVEQKDQQKVIDLVMIMDPKDQ